MISYETLGESALFSISFYISLEDFSVIYSRDLYKKK